MLTDSLANMVGSQRKTFAERYEQLCVFNFWFLCSFLPRVQRFITRLPIKMHNVLKDWVEPIEMQSSLMPLFRFNL